MLKVAIPNKLTELVGSTVKVFSSNIDCFQTKIWEFFFLNCEILKIEMALRIDSQSHEFLINTFTLIRFVLCCV